MYGIKLHRSAVKTLKRIEKGDREAAQNIADEVRRLAKTPIPNGAVQLIKDIYRVRVGEYRIIYAVFHHCEIVIIGKIDRRSEDTYKDINKIAARTIELLAEHFEQEKK